MYIVQAKKRVNDPQVGKLLRKIYDLEQILVTNKGQFIKFYSLYKKHDLPEELTMDEINRLKVEIIKEIMVCTINNIERGVYSES